MKIGRLHVRLEAELTEQIKDYARRHRTTVTRLIERHLIRLLEKEQQKQDAEQIV